MHDSSCQALWLHILYYIYLHRQTDRQTILYSQHIHIHEHTCTRIWRYRHREVTERRAEQHIKLVQWPPHWTKNIVSTRICNLVSATVDHHTTQVSAAPPQSECYTCTSLGPPKDALTRISRQRSTGTEDRRSCERAPKITWTSTEDHVNEHRRSRERTGTKRSCGENSGEKIKHACAYVHAQCSCTYTHAPMV
jgi:hypothetical protein